MTNRISAICAPGSNHFDQLTDGRNTMLFCKFKKPVLVAAAALLWLAAQTPVKAFELLTEEEIVAFSGQEITFRQTPPHPQGPQITVRQPDISRDVSRPFDIEVEFSPRDNATINTDSLSILISGTSYILGFQRELRNVNIIDKFNSRNSEITPQYLKAPRAEIPRGDYSITISIEDNRGRRGEKVVRATVL